MNLRFPGFIAVTVAVAFSVCALSKPQTDDAFHKTSDLKVTVVPDKNSFVLHETVNTRVEFRNLGNKTYCFPKPSLDCTNDFPGSAVTTGWPVANNSNSEQFICHFDSGGPPRVSDPKSELKQHWVVLAPNGVYLSERTKAKVDLNVLGEWRLETTYSQPQGAFNPAAVKKYLTSLAESAACSLPPAAIKSEPVAIHVVADSKD